MTWRDAEIEGPIAGRAQEAIARQEAIFRNTFVESLGVRIEEARPGFAVATAVAGPKFLHPGDYGHGGAIAGLGDTAAAWATFPALDDDHTHTTIEFKCNFLRAVVPGMRLRAEANALHAGRRTMVLDVRITDGDGKLVAAMSVTQAIVALSEGRPAQAAAREGS